MSNPIDLETIVSVGNWAMRKNLTAGIASVGFALMATTPANAVVKIDFDTLQSSSFSNNQFVFVDNYYDGGTSTPGIMDGPDYGVSFHGFVAASQYGETSQPNFAVTIYIAPAIIDVAAGFRGGISFTEGSVADNLLELYSGLDGTGTLLAEAVVPAGDFNAFAPYSLNFNGVARSALFTPDPGAIGIDDLRLGAVPEPAAWTLLLIGFGGPGAALRARRHPSLSKAS